MRKKPFKIKLTILIYVLCFISIGLYSIIQFRYTEQVFLNKFEQEKFMVEEQVLLAVKDADVNYSMLELQFDEQIRNALYDMHFRYMRDGSLKLPGHAIVPGVNYYVIDENNSVIMTTDPIDKGLSFQGIPEFVAFLDSVRKNGIYLSDRLSFSVRDNRVMRYSYLPSGDGRYIFEAGLNMKIMTEKYEGIGFESIEKKIRKNHEFVESVTVYDRDGNSYIYDPSGGLIKMDSKKLSILHRALDEETSIDQSEKRDGYHRYYRYIPYKIENAIGTNQQNIIEVIYNDKHLLKELNELERYTFSISLVWLVMSALLSIFLARSVSRPIEIITKAVHQVSAGNYFVETDLKTGDELEYLSKSFDQMVRTIHELREEDYAREAELERALAENRRLYYETVKMLANAIEAKDQYTGGHCDRVKDYAVLIGVELGLQEGELQNLIYGSLLHDIGKIGIPEDILRKEGKLSDFEMNLVRQHPEIGFRILHSTQFLMECRRMVYEHHERFDGLGYPQGLKGLDIDLYARIIAVADSYDAMTTIRPHRKIPLTKEEAIGELIRNSGTQFDPNIVGAFIDAFATKGAAG
ncbi:HD domain-containing protein [Anoxybacterium hadale]|uniref:HD domain-containing protein n=1 Tax=Anoxybacterium hadale TaxID=3408580 RepID=A0ACD1AAZ7_9FIRM|nr:HD domain-containing protein [Clostridiales bacterium]